MAPPTSLNNASGQCTTKQAPGDTDLALRVGPLCVPPFDCEVEAWSRAYSISPYLRRSILFGGTLPCCRNVEMGVSTPPSRGAAMKAQSWALMNAARLKLAAPRTANATTPTSRRAARAASRTRSVAKASSCAAASAAASSAATTRRASNLPRRGKYNNTPSTGILPEIEFSGMVYILCIHIHTPPSSSHG